MKNEVLLAVVTSLIDEAIAKHEHDAVELQGRRGRAGKDFDFSEYESEIYNQVKTLVDDKREELKFKFSDLSLEEVASLRGTDGKGGPRGYAGKDFSFEENRVDIEESIRCQLNDIRDALKIKFSDLTHEEVEQIRGQRGRDGRSFVFEEHKEEITKLLNSQREELKLKFSDLTDEEKDFLKLKFFDLSEEDKFSLRGSRGQKGAKGHGFVYEEHQSKIENTIADKVVSVFDSEREGLKLTFADLTKGEKDSLKLKFSDLKPVERFLLKGDKGDIGKIGPSGSIGAKGEDGRGIVDVRLEDDRTHFWFIITYSDGTEIKTSEIKIPERVQQNLTVMNILNAEAAAAANTILTGLPCAINVVVGDAVYVDLWGLLRKAIATSLETSNVLGLVESKESDSLCSVRFLGVTAPIFAGLDTSKEYFLSDIVEGAITITPPAQDASGHIVLKLGQPLDANRFLVSKGERGVRT